MEFKIEIPKGNYYAAMSDAYNTHIITNMQLYYMLETSCKASDENNVAVEIYLPERIPRTSSQFIRGSEINDLLNNIESILDFNVSTQRVQELYFSIPVFMKKPCEVYAKKIAERFYSKQNNDTNIGDGFKWDELGLTFFLSEIIEEAPVCENELIDSDDGAYPCELRVYVYNPTQWFGRSITIQYLLESRTLLQKTMQLADDIFSYEPHNKVGNADNRIAEMISSINGSETTNDMAIGDELHMKLKDGIAMMNMFLSI